MPEDSKRTHYELVQQILTRVGRNLVRVQSLENGLKNLLPFLTATGEESCVGVLAERRENITKNTLGKLIGELQKHIDSDEAFQGPTLAEALEKIRTDRNNLVHHFHKTFDADIATSEGCQGVLRRLDEQFMEVNTIESMVSGLLLSVLHCLKDDYSDQPDTYQILTKITHQFAMDHGWYEDIPTTDETVA